MLFVEINGNRYRIKDGYWTGPNRRFARYLTNLERVNHVMNPVYSPDADLDSAKKVAKRFKGRVIDNREREEDDPDTVY